MMFGVAKRAPSLVDESGVHFDFATLVYGKNWSIMMCLIWIHVYYLLLYHTMQGNCQLSGFLSTSLKHVLPVKYRQNPKPVFTKV